MTMPRFADFRGCLALNLIGVAALCGSASSMPAAPATMRVGSMLLERCANLPAYCGRLDRPLDPTGAIPGRISIYFEFYPHTGRGTSAETLVATEGGPGYPATLSRDDYLALFKPLRTSHDVVLMDNRGTGKSGAIDCRELQTGEKWTVESVAACGESLGDRAALYSTAYAADDLAAILEALDVRQIDLYGDSYGTYFEQVFALRHPRYSAIDRARRRLSAGRAGLCLVSDLCTGDARQIQSRLPALEGLRRITGQLDRARDPAHRTLARGSFRRACHGRRRAGNATFTANASLLATVMFASAPALASLRELDAAARAFMEDDRAPLLRLMAETLSGVDSRDPTADATKWSAGLAAAVMCQDPPQIFDMRLAPEPRAADRDRAVAERQRAFPDTYAPFTIDEYRAMPLDYSYLDQCVAWPVSPPGHPAGQVVPADAAYPDIPALILSGEFDDITTMAEGEAVAKAFKHGRQIRLANSFHVNALPRARSACGAEIVRRFIATLEPGDVGCAAKVPPLPLVPRFARKAAQLEPAVGLDGNSADAESLQWVSAAVLTAGDVLARLGGNSTDGGEGLRGGSFRFAPHGGSVRITLRSGAMDRGFGRFRNHRQAGGSSGHRAGAARARRAPRPCGTADDPMAGGRSGGALARSRHDRRHRGRCANAGAVMHEPSRSCARRSAGARIDCDSIWKNAAATETRTPS